VKITSNDLEGHMKETELLPESFNKSLHILNSRGLSEQNGVFVCANTSFCVLQKTIEQLEPLKEDAETHFTTMDDFKDPDLEVFRDDIVSLQNAIDAINLLLAVAPEFIEKK